MTTALVLIGLMSDTAHNSSITQFLAFCVKDFHVDFSLLIASLQMCILLLSAADISHGHPASKHLQKSLVFLIIPALSTSLKQTGITVTKMAAAYSLHQTGDGERCLKQNCPGWSSKSKIISSLLHLSKVQTWVFRTPGCVLLPPNAACQFEHRPTKEHLQMCTKHDYYRCVLKLKPYVKGNQWDTDWCGV